MESIEIFKTRDCKYCIATKNKDNVITLGSKYNFENDCHKIMKALKNINIKTTIIINGLYNGEYIEELNSRLTKENKVYIIEFNEIIFKLFKHKCDKYENIEVIYFHHNSKKLERAYSNIRDNIGNIVCVNFGNYNNVYNEKINEIICRINNFFANYKMKVDTIKSQKNIWFKCFINNIDKILDSDYLLGYKEIYTGYPAMVVSAGPSLQKNIDILKRLEKKVIIIANGRTLKILKKYNIEPTFVCVADSGENSYRIIKEELDCNVPLVFDELTNKDVVREYQGEKIYHTNVHMSDVSKEIFKMNKQAILYQGGSVAHTSVDFARYIGCNPIIMIGQDLAYTDNKYHGDIVCEKNNTVYNYDLLVDGMYGEKVGTSFVLNNFRINLEEYIKFYNNTLDIINATEGGALIHGCKNMKLSDVVKIYEKSKIIPKIQIKKYFTYDDKTNVKKKVNEYIRNFSDIKQNSTEILKLNKKYFDLINTNQEFSHKINTKIQKIEDKILKKISSLNFLKMMLSDCITIVMDDVRYIPKKDSTQLERIELLIEKTSILYTEIIKSIELSEKMISSALGENLEKL